MKSIVFLGVLLFGIFANAQKFRDINMVENFYSLKINNIYIPNNNLPFQASEANKYLETISKQMNIKNISFCIGHLDYDNFKIQKIRNFLPEYIFIIQNFRSNIKIFKIVNFYSFSEVWKGFIRTDSGKKFAVEVSKQLE